MYKPCMLATSICSPGAICSCTLLEHNIARGQMGEQPPSCSLSYYAFLRYTCASPFTPLKRYHYPRLFLLVSSLDNSQHEVDNHGRQQRHSQYTGSQPIIEPALPSLPNTLRSPMKSDESVDHGPHGYQREATGGDAAHSITEIEQPDGQATEDDREVKP